MKKSWLQQQPIQHTTGNKPAATYENYICHSFTQPVVLSIFCPLILCSVWSLQRTTAALASRMSLLRLFHFGSHWKKKLFFCLVCAPQPPDSAKSKVPFIGLWQIVHRLDSGAMARWEDHSVLAEEKATASPALLADPHTLQNPVSAKTWSRIMQRLEWNWLMINWV